ncbi:MAG: hypothetical protein HFI07_11590 [Lachnospiraceae bacterium]|nr:hypothetical protein [Lachnospiraceae bacterium]
MIIWIEVSLAELLFVCCCILLIVITSSIDGGSAVQSAIQTNAKGLFMANFIICMVFILVVLLIVRAANKSNSKSILVVNMCFSIYKTILIALYFFVCNCFIIIPQLAYGNVLEIIMNTIGGLFFSILSLVILLVIWGIVFAIQFWIEIFLFKEKTIKSFWLNFIVKGIANVIYTITFYKWIVVKAVSWMLELTSIDLLENLYGKSIINILETLNLI